MFGLKNTLYERKSLFHKFKVYIGCAKTIFKFKYALIIIYDIIKNKKLV